MTPTKLATVFGALILVINIFSGEIREAFEDWQDDLKGQSATLFTSQTDRLIAEMERGW